MKGKQKMSKKKVEQEEIQNLSSPSQDRSGRHAIDALLRKEGWRIFCRKDRQEPLWERIKDGRLLRQSAVLLLLDQNDVADAEYMEFLNGEGW